MLLSAFCNVVVYLSVQSCEDSEIMNTAGAATAAAYRACETAVICRACNTECVANEYRSLFKFGYILNEMTTLAQLLSFCADMKVVPEEDFMPGHICDECTQLLAQTYQFRRTVLRTDQMLRRTYGLQKMQPQSLVASNGNATVHTPISATSAKHKLRTTIIMPIVRATASQSEISVAALNYNKLRAEEAGIDGTVSAKLATRIATPKGRTESMMTYDYTQVDADEAYENEMSTLVGENDIEVEGAVEIINTIEEDGVVEEEQDEDQSTIVDELDPSDIDENSQGYEMVEEEFEVNKDDDEGSEEEEKPEEDDAYDNDDDDDADCISEDSQYETTQYGIVPIDDWQTEQGASADDCNDIDDVHTIKQTVKTRNIRVSGGRHNNPDYKCSVCMKQLSNGNSYRYHMQLHSDTTPFLCSLCGEGFKTRNAYDGHLTTHNPNNPNKCDQCGKSYRQASSLRVHMLTHSGEKPYQCEICGKGMTQKSGYKKHLLIHTGEKPHTCEICRRTFRYSSNLITHRRSHSIHKPFECNVCSKSFNSFSQLNRHKFVHTGDKPYSCDLCNKTFKRRISLTTHRIQEHLSGAGNDDEGEREAGVVENGRTMNQCVEIATRAQKLNAVPKL